MKLVAIVNSKLSHKGHIASNGNGARVFGVAVAPLLEVVALVWCCGEFNLIALAIVSAAGNSTVLARGADKQVGIRVIEAARNNRAVHLHNNILEPVGAH